MARGRRTPHRRFGRHLTRHAVLTGAPGAGKTTILAALAATGIATSHEVARRILQAPGGMALRNRDPLAFADAMLAAHTAELEKALGGNGPVVFDRGLPDVAGFLAVSGLPVSREIDMACRTLRYDGPIFRAPAWPDIYRRDAQRIQTLEQAIESDRAVTAAYRQYGYAVIDLPLTTVAGRVAFVRTEMDLSSPPD